MGAEGNAQSFSEIKKMTITDLILLDFGQLRSRATKILQDESKDEGEEFLDLARKSLRAKDIAIIDTLKKHSLLTKNFLMEAKEERGLLDEIDRFSFLLKEGRLNRKEVKTSYDKIAKNILTYLDKEPKRMEFLTEDLSKDVLNEMGSIFLDTRDFADTDFFPEEGISWKDDIQKLSTRSLDFSKDLRH